VIPTVSGLQENGRHSGSARQKVPKIGNPLCDSMLGVSDLMFRFVFTKLRNIKKDGPSRAVVPNLFKRRTHFKRNWM